MQEITVRAPAKVNLGLSVGPRGEDGYHELVNVFHAVSIFDEVTARPAAGFSVTVEAARPGDPRDHAPADPVAVTKIPLGDDNVALRATHLLAEHGGVGEGVALHIRKAIPVAGGMAGGSADAAAALVACDALWQTDRSRSDLLSLAARLGADVAFPLVGGTAVGVGRGERLTPVPAQSVLHWVFAPAEGGLSTAAVYAECDRLRSGSGAAAPEPRASEPLMAALRTGDPAALGAALHNDLEPAALSLRPALGRTLEAGRQYGALGALVSGSGPTCAFLARSASHAAELARALPVAEVCRTAWAVHGPVPGAHIVTRSEMLPGA